MAERQRQSRPSRRPSTTRRHNGYSEFYSYSSEAHDVLNDKYYRPAPTQRQRKKTSAKKNRKIRPSRKPKFVIDMNNRAKVKLMPCLALSVVVIGLVSVVFCYAKIIETKMSINALTREYQEIQTSNSLKSAQLARNYDLREVEQHALSALGMVKPAQHQIVHISVPRQNYVVQNLAVADESESIFAKISAFSKRVFAMAALW
jgi:hypothetical protein